MVNRGILLALTPIALAAAVPALAQDAADSGSDSGAGWELPRHQMAGFPSGAPTSYDCKKKTCIFLVNLSNHRVTEFRYAVAERNGAPQWSGNAFPSNFAFNSKRWTMWFPPKDMGCRLDLKVVMTIDGKNREESGTFDVCANPTLLFTIRDPLEKGKLGTVTVDPIVPNAPTPPAPATKP
ncbi:MAG: hypothetical protein ACTHJR_03165 [Sphingomonas sp.]|uniref:hypothetical protein n=1 Tax=Sphingomonas sp. TaxID=28214 RepID=UPI003F7EFCC0